MVIGVSLGLLLLQGPVSDSLRLGDALEFARGHRGVTELARAAVEESRAGIRLARALPNPTAAYGYAESPPRHTVTLDQPLDWLLRRGPDVSAARAQVARSTADSVGASAALATDVRQAFFRALGAMRLRELSQVQLATADSVTRIAERRLAHGDIPAIEHDRLRMEAAQARQALSRARAAEAEAGFTLARAIGWPDNQPLPSPVGSLSDGLDQLARDRPIIEELPQLRSARADSAAAAAELRSARAGRIPLPSIQVGAQWDDPTDPRRPPLLLAGISLPLPLWNQGGAATARAEARLRKATAAALEIRLETHRQVAAALVELEEARNRALIARDSLLPGAGRLREKAVQAYAVGETGVVPLLEALRAEREIAIQSVEDLVVYQDALATWMSFAGKSE
jgi:cobalt-zinc-cadmium efflux system outer membrane protein